MKQYDEDRDHSALDKAGGYYTRHVSAMAEEGLHSKSDIAAELAWRDYLLDAQQAKIDRLMLEYCPDEMTEDQMKNWASHQRADLHVDCKGHYCVALPVPDLRAANGG